MQKFLWWRSRKHAWRGRPWHVVKDTPRNEIEFVGCWRHRTMAHLHLSEECSEDLSGIRFVDRKGRCQCCSVCAVLLTLNTRQQNKGRVHKHSWLVVVYFIIASLRRKMHHNLMFTRISEAFLMQSPRPYGKKYDNCDVNCLFSPPNTAISRIYYGMDVHFRTNRLFH